jgi:hypothetical protein
MFRRTFIRITFTIKKRRPSEFLGGVFARVYGMHPAGQSQAGLTTGGGSSSIDGCFMPCPSRCAYGTEQLLEAQNAAFGNLTELRGP